ncbi:MAG: YcaO-like family protein [Hyphomicrobiales bacterium]
MLGAERITVCPLRMGRRRGWCESRFLTHFIDGDGLVALSTGAIGANRRDALARGLSETIERQAVFPANRRAARENEITATFAENWRSFLPDQLHSSAYRPWDGATVLPTLRTVDLIDGKISSVPAQIVYFSIKGERRHYPPSDTTGLSAHDDLGKAIVTGALELIEKTSIVASWRAKLPPRKLDIGTLDGLNDGLIAADARQLTVRLFDVSLIDEIAVCFALVQSPRDDFHYAVGASASLNTSKAAIKALNEAMQSYDSHRQYFFDPDISVATAGGHAGACLRAAGRDGFERHYGYLDRPCQIARIHTQADGLETLRETMSKHVTELHVFSFPTARNARLRTVRVISPELLWSLPALNGDVPAARRGLPTAVKEAFCDSCPEPMPFP